MVPIQNAAARSTFTMEALATMGACPVWDAALTRFLIAEAIAEADMEFGAYSKAEEANARCAIRLEQQFGPDYRRHPKAGADRKRSHAAMEAAEKQRDMDCLHPLWEAERELARVPAPTLTAALFKSALIAREEIWNDNKIDADCFALVQADFARLAGEA